MRVLMRGTWVIVLPLMVIGCSEPGERPSAEFAVIHTDPVPRPAGNPGQLPPEPTTADGGAGMIRVRGIIGMPDECDDLGAEVASDSLRLILRIIVRGSRAHRSACGPSDGSIMAEYEAAIRGLEPGVYRLHIHYDYRGVRQETRAQSVPAGPAERWPDHEAGMHEVRVQ